MRRLTSLTVAALLAACAAAQDGPPPLTRQQAIRAVMAEDLAIAVQAGAPH